MKTVENDDLMELESQLDDQSKQSSSGDFTADSLRILEALLFASDELLSADRIKAILPDNPDARKIRKMVEKINVQLQKERHPFEVVEIGGGYQFRTIAYFHPWVRQIFKEKAAKKLSMQALECLAIIAYKQPVSKAEIEAIRGVVSDGAMKTLLEKKLVTISGRSEKPGRPLQYSTTQEFLKYFGLNKIEDLPRIEEFEAIAREKMEDLSFEELSGDEEIESDIEAENQKNDSEQQEIENEGTQPAEPTALFEVIEDSDLPEQQNPLSEDQLEQQCSEEVSETVSNSEFPAQSEQTQTNPESTEIFEMHDFVNEDKIEEEAQKQDFPNEKTVTPEPTAVFEIHDFLDTLEAEASAEMNSDQTGNSDSGLLSAEKKADKKHLDSDSDQIEFETAEITVDNKEEPEEAVPDNAKALKNAAKIPDTENSAGFWEKNTGSAEDENEEVLEIFLPENTGSNDDGEDPVQQKEGFLSKIRKKKYEESEE